MPWPQIVWISTTTLGIGCELMLHGQVKRGRRHNFWSTLAISAISNAILYWGGFFDPLLGGR